MLKFQAIGRCRKSIAEQRYIWARLGVYGRLTETDRCEIRALIGDIAGSSAEGRALYDVLIRGIAPEAAGARTGVQLWRIYDMRRHFYDRACF